MNKFYLHPNIKIEEYFDPILQFTKKEIKSIVNEFYAKFHKLREPNKFGRDKDFFGNLVNFLGKSLYSFLAKYKEISKVYPDYVEEEQFEYLEKLDFEIIKLSDQSNKNLFIEKEAELIKILDNEFDNFSDNQIKEAEKINDLKDKHKNISDDFKEYLADSNGVFETNFDKLKEFVESYDITEYNQTYVFPDIETINLDFYTYLKTKKEETEKLKSTTEKSHDEIYDKINDIGNKIKKSKENLEEYKNFEPDNLTIYGNEKGIFEFINNFDPILFYFKSLINAKYIKYDPKLELKGDYNIGKIVEHYFKSYRVTKRNLKETKSINGIKYFINFYKDNGYEISFRKEKDDQKTKKITNDELKNLKKTILALNNNNKDFTNEVWVYYINYFLHRYNIIFILKLEACLIDINGGKFDKNKTFLKFLSLPYEIKFIINIDGVYNQYNLDSHLNYESEKAEEIKYRQRQDYINKAYIICKVEKSNEREYIKEFISENIFYRDHNVYKNNLFIQNFNKSIAYNNKNFYKIKDCVFKFFQCKNIDKKFKNYFGVIENPTLSDDLFYKEANNYDKNSFLNFIAYKILKK